MPSLPALTAALLRGPRAAWPDIDAASIDAARLYTGLLLWLAAIPAVCGFIGLSVIGVEVWGLGRSLRVPLLAGLSSAAVSYALSLVGVFVLALVADALAPLFGGVRERGQALKLVAFGSTAALLGGVFSLLPALAMLGLVPALYSVYLLYTGLPVLMRCPPVRALPYTAVLLAMAVVLSVGMGAAAGALGGWFRPAPTIAASAPGAAPALAQAQAAFQEAAAAGSNEALGVALGTALGAAAGAQPVQGSVPVSALKAALPATLAGLARVSMQVQDGAVLGLSASQASAEYGSEDGERRISLELTDMGAMAALAQLAAQSQGETETPERMERHWQQGGRAMQEEYEKDGSRAGVQALLKNGVVVRLAGEAMPIADLRALLERMDLAALEGLRRDAPRK